MLKITQRHFTPFGFAKVAPTTRFFSVPVSIFGSRQKSPVFVFFPFFHLRGLFSLFSVPLSLFPVFPFTRLFFRFFQPRWIFFLVPRKKIQRG